MTQDRGNVLEDRDFDAYVLVTCKKHDSLDTCQVEMVYEGDPALVSYLLTQAKNNLDTNNGVETN